ncbi:MAG: type II secretion system F family protein [Huintestinicola sp.]
MPSNKKIKSLNADEISFFCYQTAAIINSGLPLYDGLTVFADEIKDSGSAEAVSLIEAVTENMAMDKPFYSALEDTGLFPPYLISLVKAGELSGNLRETLTSLSEYYENEASVREKIKNAVLQPVAMMLIMAAVMLILIFKVLPMFGNIFSTFDPEISAQINESIALAASVGTGMLIFCGIIGICSVIFLSALSGNRSDNSVADAAAKLPFTRKYSRALSLARFSRVMGMMTASGISVSQSLDSAAETCSDPYIAKKINDCRRLVLEDTPLADAIERSELLPVFFTRTLKISYKSGSFDEAWKKISDTLSAEANSRLDNIVLVTEPLLTAVLTIMSGIILLTVMLPLMNIMDIIA